jgi:16S rRNA (guanine527-N7)-methyltransferase
MPAASAPLEPHPQVETAADFAAASGASPAQMADLEAYLSQLATANQVMNLVGPSTLDVFWSRHAWDSAQLLDLAPEARTWADLGAGAGLPGVVLAILLKGQVGAHVHLIDSMAKRCRFLAEVVRALGLPATVHNFRAEDLDIQVDVVTARACAPLVKLLGFARPYLQRGARGLFLKGQDVEAEIAEAARFGAKGLRLAPSRSDPRGRIVIVEPHRHGR